MKLGILVAAVCSPNAGVQKFTLKLPRTEVASFCPLHDALDAFLALLRWLLAGLGQSAVVFG